MTKMQVKSHFARAEQLCKEFANSPGVKSQDIANALLALTRAQQEAFLYLCDKIDAK